MIITLSVSLETRFLTNLDSHFHDLTTSMDSDIIAEIWKCAALLCKLQECVFERRPTIKTSGDYFSLLLGNVTISGQRRF